MRNSNTMNPFSIGHRVVKVGKSWEFGKVLAMDGLLTLVRWDRGGESWILAEALQGTSESQVKRLGSQT